MAIKQKNVRWISENGSIFTEATAKVKFEFTGFKEIQECVACNVGAEIADHIVELHNTRLKVNKFVEENIRGSI